MTRKSLMAKAVPRLKEYMVEEDSPLTIGEVAEFLGVTPSYAGDIMLYMETVGVVQQVKRGRKNYYFLKGALNESEADSMLPSPKPPQDGRRKQVARKRIGSDGFLNEYVESMRTRANSGDGLPALSILELTQAPRERNKKER